jgi:hypothetical protein
MEPAPSGNFGDIHAARRLKQFSSRPVEANIARTLHQHSAEEATELSLQGAPSDPASQRNLADCPAMRWILLQEVKGLFYGARYELRSHG